MYVEILPKPVARLMQFRIVPMLGTLGDAGSLLARVVIVFTTITDTRSALHLARALAPAKIGIWLVCPVARSIFGYLRVSRFLGFAKELACELEPDASCKLCFISAPCPAGADPVKFLSDARSVVLIKSRWSRLRGCGTGSAVVLRFGRLALIL